MLKASVGGRDAAHAVYRHTLVRALIPLLGSVRGGTGWSALSVALGAILMSWDPAPTLAQRFESILAVLDAALPRRRRTGRTDQGFVKALAAHGAAVIGVLIPRLREHTRRSAAGGWKLGDLVPIGVDGSKFDAPRTIANEPLGVAGKDKCGPQMMAVLLVHLGVMLPWAWARAGVRTAERTLLRSLLDVLPEQTLLVADAGFDLLTDLRERGMHFLVRVGRGVRLLSELGYARREGTSTVYLWPHDARDQPPLVLRLIRVGEVYLVTDVTDPRRLSRAMASELYRRRWGLEVAFRTLKQTLEHRKVRSQTAPHALAELDWAIVGLWTLGVLGAGVLRGAGVPPRRLSFAAALHAVRHAARANPHARVLRGRLRRAVVDAYRRRASKRAYRWPHKKNPIPPGPPTLAPATREQVRAAKALRTQSSAR